MNNLSEAVKLPPKKRIKRYQFKGYKIPSDASIIVNHAYPEQHAAMKERSTENKLANIAKHKALLQKKSNSVSCCSLAKNASFAKYDTYYKDSLMKAVIEKGKLVGLTSAEKSPYFS